MEVLDEGRSSEAARGTSTRTSGSETEQGDEYRLCSRVVDVDPVEQRITMEMQGSMRRGDELVVQERRTIVVAAYTAAHLELLLESTGFRDIQMLDNWTDAPVSRDSANITFVARRRS
jgi:hypothetical protein